MEYGTIRHVVIGFYAPHNQDPDGGWLKRLENWFIGTWTRRDKYYFSHVELRFSDGTVTSICQGETVHVVEGKLMSNENYSSFMSLPVSAFQEEQMRQMALNYRDLEIEFNTEGMLCNFLPILNRWYFNDGKSAENELQQRVFCSQYIVLLLQECGFVRWLDPAKTTPADLYIALKTGNEGARLDFNWELHKAVHGGIDVTKAFERKPRKMHPTHGMKMK